MIGMFFNIIFFIIILKRITMDGIISLNKDIKIKKIKYL